MMSLNDNEKDFQKKLQEETESACSRIYILCSESGYGKKSSSGWRTF